ncbi:nuclear transport factor 2 family protein [Tunturiibacter lichenicola]|uniref:nuclear transport factor 2 family protein n=1 Tax=Tunturiibacter lichenicola TaxID=2051959 RepID=UPI0021B4CBA6|nr:nuclear transport factor 2 family protein [Edaphobacter lichenicola]
MTHTSRFATLLFLAVSGATAIAQTPTPAPPAPAPVPLVGSIAGHPGWPVAKAEDVKSPEAILAAVYNVISGAKGQARDWDRMRSLFIPDARLIPARETTAGHADAVILTIDGYIARSNGRMTSSGFFERSIHNDIEQFGNIVQIWSTYESRHNADDATPFARGINSFQLLKDGDRYWVVNIFWDAESPTNPIPEKYLSK